MWKRSIATAVVALGSGGCGGLVAPGGDLVAAEPDRSLEDGSYDGGATSTCVSGWTEPAPGSSLYRDALRLIDRRMRLDSPLLVEEMRYFTGPESPPSGESYFLVVERWYVRGRLRGDPSFAGRWLVERRAHGAGIAAVAPHETIGYRSPDWRGFQYEFSDPTRREYPGLPGTWAGTPYDFVTGSKPLDLQIPGLPAAVVGCLAGT